MKTIAIETHWDTGAIITADSDASEEFRTWQEFAKSDAEWTGEEFTEQDFADYIGTLQHEAEQATAAAIAAAIESAAADLANVHYASELGNLPPEWLESTLVAALFENGIIPTTENIKGLASAADDAWQNLIA